MNDTGPHLGKSKQNQEISEFKILVGTNVSHVQTGGKGALVVFVNKINNLATQLEKNSGLCSIENKKNNLV
jgi:hypothetical protein